MKFDEALPPDSPEFENLLHALCDDRLSGTQEQQLHATLTASEEARRRYVEVMYLAVGVCGWARQTCEAVRHESAMFELWQRGATDIPTGKDPPVCELDRPGKSSLKHATAWVAAVAASLLLIASIATMWAGGNGAPAQVEVAAIQSDIADVEASNVPPKGATYVAHVIEATEDVRWAKKSAPFDLALRVGVGERIGVESGMLRLLYYSGATVILHGPAVFTPTGPASGHLAAGKLTGRVASTNSAGFRLTTPSADVIDLGTEFGVAVSELAETDVHVFDGEVEVNARSELATGPQPIRLKQGMSLRVSSQGLADRDSYVDREQFLRELPDRASRGIRPNEVSLVDTMIGGAGMSQRLYTALDPNTGKLDEQPWVGGRMADDLGFRHAVYNEFVDGVFIPPRSGSNTQLDSYRNVVDLPANQSRTEGPIWARRPVPGWTPEDAVAHGISGQIWGMGATENVIQRLLDCRLGVIGVHANVGISFDVHAIQSVEGRSVKRFQCIAANLDGSLPGDPAMDGLQHSIAEVRVYVDGAERYRELELSRVVGDQMIDIELGAQCRILTVVVLDADLNVNHDEVVLIDPVLVLDE